MAEPRIALPLAVSAAALARAGRRRPLLDLGGTALGTGWRVRVAGDGLSADHLRAAIEQRLAGLVDEMSQWQPESLLSRFNRAPAGSWMALPPDLATVIAAALAIAARTDGAFDPSHGRAATLLGYGAEIVARPPSDADLDAARIDAGWDKLAYDPAMRRLRQPGGLWLDLSGIAKGYAVDVVADVVAEHGGVDALVEIGGEIAARGLRPDGEPWWIDLELPPGSKDIEALQIGLHDQAVATSGDYIRGAHTLDPKTGRPLPSRLVSVSVVHDSAMYADAWATALTVHGPEAGAEIAEAECLPVRMIERTTGGRREWISSALGEMLS